MSLCKHPSSFIIYTTMWAIVHIVKLYLKKCCSDSTQKCTGLDYWWCLKNTAMPIKPNAQWRRSMIRVHLSIIFHFIERLNRILNIRISNDWISGFWIKLFLIEFRGKILILFYFNVPRPPTLIINNRIINIVQKHKFAWRW